MSNKHKVLAVLLVVLIAVAGMAILTVPVSADEGPDVEPEDDELTDEYPEGNETATGADERPEQAELARVTPINVPIETVDIETRESDAAFNTTGPVAMFSVSQPLDGARVVESPADARLEGHVVIVEYDEDAAPLDEASLYTLELFFEDGSSSTVELYASDTDLTGEQTMTDEYRGIVITMIQDAEEAGFDRSPAGVREYYDGTLERAELYDNLLVEYAIELIPLGMAILMNPVAVILVLISLTTAGYYLLRSRGWVFDLLHTSASKARQKREALALAYQRNQDAAAAEHIAEIPEVGSDEIFWRDAYGVSTVAQLASLAKHGQSDIRDGELDAVHNGVEDLKGAQDLHDTWLEPILRPGRLATPESALVQMQRACERMETKYGMGHEYRSVREDIVQLRRELFATDAESGKPAGVVG